VHPIYEAWKKAHNIPPWCPLSDPQREAFELDIDRIVGLETMDKLAERLKIEKAQKQKEECERWLSTNQLSAS